jgi:hypothetical protein
LSASIERKKFSRTAGCTFSCVPLTMPIVTARLFETWALLLIHRARPGNC